MDDSRADRLCAGAWTSVPLLRRTILTVVGVQLALALTMTLVDSYRRRGKRPKPFPVTPPEPVEVGEGTLTPYTFGRDL